MTRSLPLMWAPSGPRRIAVAIVQLVVLAIATGTVALLLAAGQPQPTPAPLHLDTTDSRTVEPMGHGGPR